MFFLWFICEKSVHFSMLFICGYHIRNHIHHKKANNSARTPTTSKTIVKMSNQKIRSVGSETVNDVSIKKRCYKLLLFLCRWAELFAL